MILSEKNSFTPDWISPPGDTIRDIFRERRRSISNLASQLELSNLKFEKLLSGEEALDDEIALKLEEELQVKKEFWLEREKQFRQEVSYQEKISWIKDFPLADMAKFGWIASVKDKQLQISDCLAFFGVVDVASWKNRYEPILNAARFRKSSTFETQTSAVSAWLRCGEIKAESLQCETWSHEGLLGSIDELRQLTRLKDPAVFTSSIQKICAKHGVAVVIVQSPNGCRVSGATFFLSESKALILLSFRYLTDDHFWFTFFHEIGHLILHSKSKLFLEDDELDVTQEEREANEFSENTLLPKVFRNELATLNPNKPNEILRFAKKVGISPGIVIGQLQHSKSIKPSQFNRYKNRYDWASIVA